MSAHTNALCNTSKGQLLVAKPKKIKANLVAAPFHFLEKLHVGLTCQSCFKSEISPLSPVSISSSMSLPAFMAAASVENGASPDAMRSAFTKLRQCA